MTLRPVGSVLRARPAEPIQCSPENGVGLSMWPIVARVRLHDLDRLGCAAVTDVYPTGKDSPRAGHELRDFSIGPTAERAAHRFPQHVHTSNPNLKHPMYSRAYYNAQHGDGHASASNLGLMMRTLFAIGTPRALQGRAAAILVRRRASKREQIKQDQLIDFEYSQRTNRGAGEL